MHGVTRCRMHGGTRQRKAGTGDPALGGAPVQTGVYAKYRRGKYRADHDAARLGDLEKETMVLARLGDAVSARDFALATRRIRRLGRQLAGFFARHDLLLTPTLARPPVAIGELSPRGAEATMLEIAQRLPVGKLLYKLGALHRIAATAWGFAPFTAPFNATGQPAISLPLHWNDAGLPIGVQLVAAYGREDLLLRTSAQLETAQPFIHAATRR